MQLRGATVDPTTNRSRIRSQILLEAAFFQAHFRHDAGEARRLLSESRPGKVVENSLPPRAEAAVLLAEGDNERAKAYTAAAPVGASAFAVLAGVGKVFGVGPEAGEGATKTANRYRSAT